jgi:hypothetical protein
MPLSPEALTANTEVLEQLSSTFDLCFDIDPRTFVIDEERTHKLFGA